MSSLNLHGHSEKEAGPVLSIHTGGKTKWISFTYDGCTVTLFAKPKEDGEYDIKGLAEALAAPLFELQMEEQAAAHDAEEAAIAALSEPRGAILPLQQAIHSVDQSNGLDMVDMPF